MPARLEATLMISMLLGGCYVSAPLDDEVTSGSRLRRIVLRPASGEPVFVGWHDAELDADCWFQRAADGVLRCLPLGAAQGSYYLDEGCSQRAGRALEPCVESPFSYELVPSGTCGSEPARIEVFATEGEAIEVDRLYTLREGVCVASETPWPRVRRATAIDPARFVAAEVIRGEGGAIARDRLVAGDGARQEWRWRDTARDVLCQATGSGDLDRVPCAPDGAWRVSPGGALCDERWASETCRPVPEIGYSLVRDGCNDIVGTEIYTVHEAVPEPERAMVGRECRSAATGEVHRARRDDGAVPWLTREWRGTGRIQLATWVDDDGRALGAWIFYRDRELDTVCVPQWTADGIRCVPGAPFPGVAAFPLDAFRDSGCTERATSGRNPGCEREFAFDFEPVETCPSALQLTAVYRLGARLETVYRIDATTGACVADGDGGYDLERIPLTSLARLDRVIE